MNILSTRCQKPDASKGACPVLKERCPLVTRASTLTNKISNRIKDILGKTKDYCAFLHSEKGDGWRFYLLEGPEVEKFLAHRGLQLLLTLYIVQPLLVSPR